MKIFRKFRDPEGKFALTTLQNPNFDVGPCLERFQEVKARAEARIAAEAAPLLAKLPAQPANPPVENLPPPEPVRESRIEVEPTAAVEKPQEKPQEKPAPVHRPARRHKKVALKKYKRAASQSARSLAVRRSKPELTSLERHSRKCLICKHPDREQIDHEFLSWQHPKGIASDFDLPEARYVYRHARATGLLDLRRMNVRSALECFIEECTRVRPKAETIIRAIRAYTRINARGEWSEPPSHVIYSTHHENVHQSVHQDIAHQLNVAVQSASAPIPLSAPELPPAPIDIQLLPSAATSPDISPAAQPDSNHGSVIRNHAKPLKTKPK
jgi:hypothetical protein